MTDFSRAAFNFRAAGAMGLLSLVRDARRQT